MTVLRIGFMGTPDFAVAALDALHTSGHEVVCAYTQPPRPKGRGHQVQPSPVHQYADNAEIPVFHPRSFKSADVQAEFAAHNLDLAVVAAYGLILPAAALDAPRYGCINIHASLLPRWRGASPIQRAILAGDAQTGISLMQMDEGLDTGPVIMTRALPIRPQTTATSLHDALAALGGAMIEEAVNALARDGGLDSTPQDDALATYAPLLKKTDGRVDWTQPAEQIDRLVRALNPWPGVWTEINGKRLKILEAAPGEEHKNQPPGMVLDSNGRIACGAGRALRLARVQPDGKKPMDFRAAVNGGYLKAGDILV